MLNQKTIVLLAIMAGALFSGCGTFQSGAKDIVNDFTGGDNRTITLYAADGAVIREWKGKIYLEESDGDSTGFLLDGARYVVNGTFIIEEKSGNQ